MNSHEPEQGIPYGAPPSNMPEPYFILPNGDAVLILQIAGVDGRVTHSVSATAVLNLLDDFDRDRRTIKMLSESVERERARIRRLMAALTDEVVR